MDVGLGDMGDPEALRLSRADVPSDIPVRVDDERLTGGGAADEIARLGKLGIVEPFEEHAVRLLAIGYWLRFTID